MTEEVKLKSRESVHRMFGRIARTYDIANRIITFGFDGVWRRFAVRSAGLQAGSRVLDIGCGTGDIACEVERRVKDPTLVAADFSAGMILEGKRSKKCHSILWCLADACCLPFPDDCFDAVLSGYLVRNVTDVAAAFREQMRVVKPGGKVVCLETCPPARGLRGLPVRIYTAFVIPWIGRIISGDGDAYRYLHQSTGRFMEPSRLASAMQHSGLEHLFFRKFMLGTQAVHVAVKRKNFLL
jgi:demethylmenaquinone methyltransferase / 2-methoxy-6-polyprenyl-1,4-benzoquinol methylase